NSSKMSSSTSSPHRFSGAYDSFYSDAAAAAATVSQDDINGRMKVPKRIRVTGEHDDSPSVNWENYSKAMPEKLTMNVPERIIVAVGDNYIGSRGIPREFEIEDSILPRPPDPAMYRVNTPPRTITLNNYTPEQDEDVAGSPQSSVGPRHAHTYPSVMSGPPQQRGPVARNTPFTGYVEDNTGVKNGVSSGALPALSSNNSSPMGGMNEELTAAEELQLLRRQVGRLNRRLMALELD
ncbi:hypothetical protein FHG87_012223, partial [Trinorchestia longiramus]